MPCSGRLRGLLFAPKKKFCFFFLQSSWIAQITDLTYFKEQNGAGGKEPERDCLLHATGASGNTCVDPSIGEENIWYIFSQQNPVHTLVSVGRNDRTRLRRIKRAKTEGTKCR